MGQLSVKVANNSHFVALAQNWLHNWLVGTCKQLSSAAITGLLRKLAEETQWCTPPQHASTTLCGALKVLLLGC
jgi:hypothetical protein